MKYLILAFLMVNVTACNLDQKPKKADIDNKEEELLKRGKQIAQSTFKALSEELQKSMAEGGIEEAIAYCNINALPITDRLSKEYNAVIKRTSLKYRNPINAPTKGEIKILQDYQELKNKGEEMKPILVEGDMKHIFYAPIVMQEMCLKCHGPKNEISKYEQILAKYPDDLATEYQSGDLRGMWSVALLPTNK